MQVFSNPFEALFEDKAEAANLQARALLFRKLYLEVKSWNITQTEAALRLGISQPRLNYILKQKFDKFSLDMLFILSNRAGLIVNLEINQAA
jgi:predicted XRE-type DNA-binding protein